VRLLGISGSLRGKSSNRAVLLAAATLMPPGAKLDIYPDMGALPLFNPDIEEASAPLPASVVALRDAVGRADGLLIACPEYAHGVPGGMKNLLDWLVGSLEFPSKPVALLNTAPRASHAQAQLREILPTMGARLMDAASFTVPLPNNRMESASILADLQLADAIAVGMRNFVTALRS
jgi:chromate reductase, NAD(P)H dehydrogenase (quinone)